jgi:hypothetical protein
MSRQMQIATILGILLFAGSSHSLAQSAQAYSVHANNWSRAEPVQFGHRCRHHKHREGCGGLNRNGYPRDY